MTRPSYTIWSRGRKVGETDLGHVRVTERHRMGWFHPTEVGHRIIPLATETRSVLLASIVPALDRSESDPPMTDEEFLKTTEGADLLAAEAHADALMLELRAPDGSVIPTDWIDIRDTHVEIPEIKRDEPTEVTVDPEYLAEIEELMESFAQGEGWKHGRTEAIEPEPEEFPRYQVQVMLMDDSDVPRFI